MFNPNSFDQFVTVFKLKQEQKSQIFTIDNTQMTTQHTQFRKIFANRCQITCDTL